MNIKCAIEVKGIPNYAEQYPYWIITVSDNSAWFHACFKTLSRAEKEVASFDNGIVISSLRAEMDD